MTQIVNIITCITIFLKLNLLKLHSLNYDFYRAILLCNLQTE